MSPKRTYFLPTTSQQRKLLFKTWEVTGDLTEACRKAHVGCGTFYYGKPHFDVDGYTGLETYEKKGPEKGHGRIYPGIEQKVLELHDQHGDWGKHRIADEMAKVNNWVPLVSPNTVRPILEEAGLWKPEERGRKEAPSKP